MSESSSAGRHSDPNALAPDAVRALLPEYATTVALSNEPLEAYAEVAAHLQGYAVCREEFDELLELVMATYTGQVEPAPAYPQPDLSFLRRREREPAVMMQPGFFDQVGRLIVTFSEELLASLRQPSLAGAARGQLVYRYTQSVPSQNLDVVIEVYTDDTAPGMGRVLVTVDLPNRGPLDQAGSHVTLRANGETWEGVTDEAGCAIITGVPLGALPRLRAEIAPKRDDDDDSNARSVPG